MAKSEGNKGQPYQINADGAFELISKAQLMKAQEPACDWASKKLRYKENANPAVPQIAQADEAATANAIVVEQAQTEPAATVQE